MAKCCVFDININIEAELGMIVFFHAFVAGHFWMSGVSLIEVLDKFVRFPCVM